MKKIYFLLLLIASTFSTANAQTFEWGTATWNIPDGKVFENIDEFNVDGVILTYPNPTNYTLTFFHVIGVNYDLYVDDVISVVDQIDGSEIDVNAFGEMITWNAVTVVGYGKAEYV